MRKIIYILAFIGAIACTKQEPSLYFQLKDINELTLAEVRVEKTFVIDDPDIRFKEIGSRSGIFSDMIDWMKRKTSVGKRIGVYSFGTYFSAYIDLSRLREEDVVIDRKKKICSIALPPIRIKEWGRDFEVKTEHERVSMYRIPLTPQEKAKAKNEASRILLEEIEEDSGFKPALRKSGEEKARLYFETLLSNWGYQSDITFKEE